MSKPQKLLIEEYFQPHPLLLAVKEIRLLPSLLLELPQSLHQNKTQIAMPNGIVRKRLRDTHMHLYLSMNTQVLINVTFLKKLMI